MIAPKPLAELLTSIADSAPNIEIVRIGTRLPVQDPALINADIYSLFRHYSKRFLLEVAIQINHPLELQSESVDAIERLGESGARIYSQNVLLKGVNDEIETLTDLYDRLRSLKVIPHYLFHAVPMVGTDSFRTSVARGLELARQLSASGYLSGMSKPAFTVMTAIGKVTLYEGSILSKQAEVLTIRSSYRLEDRVRWNPGYRLPDSAMVNELGTLDVQYVDGVD